MINGKRVRLIVEAFRFNNVSLTLNLSLLTIYMTSFISDCLLHNNLFNIIDGCMVWRIFLY